MTLQQIATDIAKEYDLPIHELRRKKYQADELFHMKVDFVVQARNAGFTNKQVADFMDYAESSTSELYGVGMAGEDRYKYEQLLSLLQEGKAVTKDDFKNVRTHAKALYKKGYPVYKSPDGYCLG